VVGTDIHTVEVDVANVVRANIVAACVARNTVYVSADVTGNTQVLAVLARLTLLAALAMLTGLTGLLPDKTWRGRCRCNRCLWQ
jgi:hypothetical protein